VAQPQPPAGLLTFTPYLIRTQFRCDAQQRQAIDFEQRAQRVLEAGESMAMETELYAGAAVGWAALNPVGNLQLTHGAVDLSGTATPTTPRLGLIDLIQAAAFAGAGRCMIHATPATVTGWWQAGGLEKARDGRLVTTIGSHIVVSGDGYTGRGPDNVFPGSNSIHWAWITTPVYTLRGDLEILEATDWRDNDAEVIVQRPAVAYWDGCLHAGLPIDTRGVIY
jgi:hypothetical protein